MKEGKKVSSSLIIPDVMRKSKIILFFNRRGAEMFKKNLICDPVIANNKDLKVLF
jgi:hypothetical protein